MEITKLEVTKGFQEESTDVEIAMWNDNGAVMVSVLPLSNARRWSKETKDYVSLPRPSMIGAYNASMGGTDQINQSVASYQPLLRNHKWYWPLFIYSVEITFYNSGLL